jgi:hypothetical protein
MKNTERVYYCCESAQYICEEYCDIKLNRISIMIGNCNGNHVKQSKCKLDCDNFPPTLLQLHLTSVNDTMRNGSIPRCSNLPHYIQCLHAYSDYILVYMHLKHSKSLQLSMTSLQHNINYSDTVILYCNRYIKTEYYLPNLYYSPNLCYINWELHINMIDYAPYNIIECSIYDRRTVISSISDINVSYDNLPPLIKYPSEINPSDLCTKCKDSNNYKYLFSCKYLCTVNMRNLPFCIQNKVTS